MGGKGPGVNKLISRSGASQKGENWCKKRTKKGKKGKPTQLGKRTGKKGKGIQQRKKSTEFFHARGCRQEKGNTRMVVK